MQRFFYVFILDNCPPIVEAMVCGGSGGLLNAVYIIKPGDVVTFLVSPGGEERLRNYLAERVERTEPALPTSTVRT